MAKRPIPFRFRFLGWQGGWYALLLRTHLLDPREVCDYRRAIVDWLFDYDIPLNDLSYLANGNTGDGPAVPVPSGGNTLCLMFRRAADVLRFDNEFGVQDLTPEAMFAALRAEASVPKFVLASLAAIAYAAIRQFEAESGVDFPDWDELDDDDQQFFLQLVREYLEHPDWTAERLHEAWMDRRQLEGWHYSADVDLPARQHPSMVPFGKLPEHEQIKTRLTVGVIASLAPLLRRA